MDGRESSSAARPFGSLSVFLETAALAEPDPAVAIRTPSVGTKRVEDIEIPGLGN